MKNILLVLIVLFLFSFMSISFAQKMGRGGRGAAPGSRPWWWDSPFKTTGGKSSNNSNDNKRASGQKDSVGLLKLLQDNPCFIRPQ